MKVSAFVAVAVILMQAVATPAAAAVQPTNVLAWSSFLGPANCKNSVYYAAHPIECSKKVAQAVSTVGTVVGALISGGAQAVTNVVADTWQTVKATVVEIPPQEACLKQGADAFWADGYCQFRHNGDNCVNGGGVWTGNQCQYTIATLCARRGLPVLYANPNNPYDGACLELTQAPPDPPITPPVVPTPVPGPAPPRCPATHPYLAADDECYVSVQEYQKEQCSLRADYVWDNGCISMQEYCKKSNAEYSSAHGGCVGTVKAQQICDQLGYLWVAVESKCYVISTANVPQGLDRFFYAATTAQEKALLSQYNVKLTELVYKARSDSDAAYQKEVANVDAQWNQAFRELETELAKEISDLSDDYETSLEEYHQDVLEMQRFSKLIEERIKASYYAGTVQPSNSLGVMRTTYDGVQYKDVRVEFPKGIPTPVASGDNWAVNIPVTITFPEVDYEGVEVTFIGGAVHYAFSVDAGKTFQRGEVPVDFTTNGNEAQKITLYVKVNFAKASGNYDLRLKADLVFTEEYRFEGGMEYALEDMVRRGPELQRTFYTSANPFDSVSKPVVNDVDVTSTAQDAAGQAPSGLAGTWNWLAETQSQTESKVKSIDATTGIGLQHVLKVAPYAAGAGVLVFGYFKGFLDFLPFLGKFRAKRLAAKAAKNEFDLSLGDLEL